MFLVIQFAPNNIQQVLSLDLIPTQGPLGHSQGPLEVPKPHSENRD